jgi:hypothetical protein
MVSTSIADDPDLTASLEMALEVAEHFALQAHGARSIVTDV